jgi:hypothetical protein
LLTIFKNTKYRILEYVVRLVPAGSGCFGLVLAGPVYFRFVLAGSGWFWFVPTTSGWFWLVMAGSGWSWLVPAGPGWSRLVPVGSGRLVPVGSGRLVPLYNHFLLFKTWVSEKPRPHKPPHLKPQFQAVCTCAGRMVGAAAAAQMGCCVLTLVYLQKEKPGMYTYLNIYTS